MDDSDGRVDRVSQVEREKKIKEQKRAWYLKNKEKQQARKKVKRMMNNEFYKEQNKKYYDNHKEEICKKKRIKRAEERAKTLLTLIENKQ